MATSSEHIIPFQESIESMVTCSICLDRMIDPRTLSCLHSYCKSCLEQLEVCGRRRMCCPLCREDTYLSANGVEGLRKNFLVTQLLVEIEKSEQQNSVIAEEDSSGCTVCQKYLKKEDSLWLCKKCDVNRMCFWCADRHLVVNHDHEVSPVDTENKSQNCVLHDNQTEDRWCSACDEALCDHCETAFHNSCRKSKKILDLNIESQSRRAELISLLAEGRKKLPNLDSDLKILSDNLSKKMGEETMIVLMVKKCKEKLMEQIKASMDKEEVRCATQVKEHIEEVGKQGVLLKRLLTEDIALMQNVVEESESLLKRNDNGALIMMSSNTIKTAMAGLLTSSESESEPYFVPRLTVPLSKNLEKLCEQFTSKVIGDVVIERNYKEIRSPLHEFKVTDFQPTYLTVDTSCVYLSNNSKRCISIYSLGGQKVRVFGKTELSNPSGVAVNNEKQVFVCDTGNKRICVYGETGGFETMFNQKTVGGNINLYRLSGIIVTPDNKIIATEVSENKVLIIDANTGELITTFGEQGDGHGQLSCPSYVTYDPIHKRILISEQGNHRVQVFNLDGEYITMFGRHGKGDEDFNLPTGLAVDQFGNIVIGDYYNSCLKFYSEDLLLFHTVDMYNSKPSDIAFRQDGRIVIAGERNKIISVY